MICTCAGTVGPVAPFTSLMLSVVAYTADRLLAVDVVLPAPAVSVVDDQIEALVLVMAMTYCPLVLRNLAIVLFSSSAVALSLRMPCKVFLAWARRSSTTLRT